MPQPDPNPPPCAPLRPPDTVMRLQRLGSFHQTRLSFMRTLLRSLRRENWQFSRSRWEVDARGRGVALYRAARTQNGATRVYTLVCFAHDLPDAARSDRVIATEWDATFALYDGEPDAAELRRLADNIPKQEAGGCRARELVMARANRSVRLFSYVVECLARGVQPEREKLAQRGYLMRTTAVYGNGKFGLCDREPIADRGEFAPPFRAEMLTVWLIRWFTIDLAEHLAQVANPQQAVKLARDLARSLGVGNATGLGMAPFLVLHPSLIHAWICARETALARVCGLPQSSPATRRQFGEFARRMQIAVQDWRTEDPLQSARNADLLRDLAAINAQLERGGLTHPNPWQQLVAWSQTALSLEGQELLVTLVLEPHAALIDDLADEMAVDESRYWRVRGQQSIAELQSQIAAHYGWALSTDYASRAQCARFWYVSEEKLEPRLGERFDEPGADQEQPLAFARDIAALHHALRHADSKSRVAEFLLRQPQHRDAVRRVQIAAQLPYAEIRDNLIGADLRPIDLLRCKLSFFGASKFDPKSDRWVRITMYQYAPLPDELAEFDPDADHWIYPPLPRSESSVRPR